MYGISGELAEDFHTQVVDALNREVGQMVVPVWDMAALVNAFERLVEENSRLGDYQRAEAPIRYRLNRMSTELRQEHFEEAWKSFLLAVAEVFTYAAHLARWVELEAYDGLGHRLRRLEEALLGALVETRPS